MNMGNLPYKGSEAQERNWEQEIVGRQRDDGRYRSSSDSETMGRAKQVVERQRDDL
jgi:hypothetical protein